MSIKFPTISVLIVANRHSPYLLGTINSVRQQTFADLEILILYAGKSTKLVQWLERQEDPRIRLIFCPNNNPACMGNLGVKQAQGEYIAFLQGEDLWQRQKLQKQVFLFDCYPDVGLIHSWYTSIDSQGRLVDSVSRHQLSGWVYPLILERNRIGYSSVIVRRSCFDKVGLFDPKLPSTMDWDLWIRLSRHYQFMTVRESLFYYRQYPQKVPEIWLKLETDLQATIEKAYSQTTSELLMAQKNRSYGYASLDLAREVLQDRNADPAIAHNYCRQVLEHSPGISFSREFWQVSLEIILLGWFQSDRFRYLISLCQTLSNWLRFVLQKLKQVAYLILNWMLEERENPNEDIADSALNFKE